MFSPKKKNNLCPLNKKHTHTHNLSHSAVLEPEKKSLNFIFPTKYVIPKSLKFSHWPSKLFARVNCGLTQSEESLFNFFYKNIKQK